MANAASRIATRLAGPFGTGRQASSLASSLFGSRERLPAEVELDPPRGPNVGEMLERCRFAHGGSPRNLGTSCRLPAAARTGKRERTGRIPFDARFRPSDGANPAMRAWAGACAPVVVPRRLADGAAPSGILRAAMSHPRRQQLRRLLRSGIRAASAIIALAVALPVAALGERIVALTLVLAASSLAVASRRDLRLAARNRIGAESEAAVRQALATLSNEGWRVRHAVDWPQGGDLDHLVRAPSGVGFVIETKTAR
jgi:Nuclease-related domain